MKTKLLIITLVFAISTLAASAQRSEENISPGFDFSGKYFVEGNEEYQPNEDYSFENRAPGSILLDLDVQTPSTQFVTMGSGFDGTYIWITSGGVVGSLEPNTLIKMTLEGEVIEVYQQNTTDPVGMRDMTFDGEYLYAGDENGLYQVDPANGVVTTLVTGTPPGINVIRGLAYDSTTNSFWCSDVNTGTLMNFTIDDGSYTILTTYSPPVLGGSQGLAYDDNDGDPCLWVLRRYWIGLTPFLEVVQWNVASQNTGIEYPVNIVTGGVMAGGLGYDFGTIFPGKICLHGTAMGYYDRFFVMEIGSTAPDEAPGYPSNLTITPASAGILTIDAFWVNPVYTVAGDLLSELNSVDFYIDDDQTPLYTHTSPNIGGLENPLAVDVSLYGEGMHAFTVIGTNSMGEGVPTVMDVWLGEDVPAAPGNVILENWGSGHIQLSWEVPVEGMHDGYFTGAGITYDIIRFPGGILVSEDMTELVFQEVISGTGNFRYEVVAKNGIGVGGTGLSNAMAIGADNYLIWEEFSAGNSNWTIDGPNTDNWWLARTDYAGGEIPELMFRFQPDFIGNSTAISQQVETSGAQLLSLEFNHYIKQDDEGYTVSVVTSSNGYTWNEVWSMEGSNYGPVTEYVIIDNDDVGSATFQLGFRFSGNSDYIDYWCIDNINLMGSSSCLPPNNLSSDPWDTYANLSWNENGSANIWEIEWGLSGFTQGNGTTITGITNNPYTLDPPFTPGTNYDWYVRADCGAGDYSPWVGPSTFISLPSPITVFPLLEDFETFTVGTNSTGYKNGWSTSPANTESQFSWNVWQGETPTANSGPAVDHTTGTATGKYIFTEASYGFAGEMANVYSPIYDFAGISEPQISFWYHMYGSDIGQLHLDINTGSGWINDIVPALVGQQQTSQDDAWLETTVNLTIYSGQTVKFRFRGDRGDGWIGDMAIDDVSLTYSTVSTNTASISNNIDIYPNPSTGIFTALVDKEYTLNVIDIVGNIVYTTTLTEGQHKTDLSGMPTGLYFFRLTSDAEVLNYRVLVVK